MHLILCGMDRLWTPWRYSYIVGAQTQERKGVPADLAGWPGEDLHCVFCNLNAAVVWGLTEGIPNALAAGHVVARLKSCFVCLNAYPYSTGHVLLLPYQHKDSLAKLDPSEAEELMQTMQHLETVLNGVYGPDGMNVGVNLGEAAGAGVAAHLHIHMLPRWFGDTNFMTVTAETRVLPETLDVTWMRLKEAFDKIDAPKYSEPIWKA